MSKKRSDIDQGWLSEYMRGMSHARFYISPSGWILRWAFDKVVFALYRVVQFSLVIWYYFYSER